MHEALKEIECLSLGLDLRHRRRPFKGPFICRSSSRIPNLTHFPAWRGVGKIIGGVCGCCLFISQKRFEASCTGNAPNTPLALSQGRCSRLHQQTNVSIPPFSIRFARFIPLVLRRYRSANVRCLWRQPLR